MPVQLLFWYLSFTTVDYKYKRSLQKILHKQFLFPVWDPNAGKDSLQL